MTKRLARILLVPAVAAAVLIPAGAAQARPVDDAPVYCGPGYHVVGGGCVADRHGGGGHF